MNCTCSRSRIVLLSKLGRARDLSENEHITQLSFTRGTEWKEKRILWRFNALAS
jgi:hypothetical protein